MRIIRYLIFLVTTIAAASLLSAPISSFFSLYWVSANVKIVSIDQIIYTLLSDIFNYGPTLFLIYLIGFFPVFMIAIPILNYLKIQSPSAFGLMGIFSVMFSIFLVQELIVGTKVISGSRTFLGLLLHYFAGYLSGLLFHRIRRKQLTKKFILVFSIIAVIFFTAPTILVFTFS